MILPKIKNRYRSLTATEKRIASFVLNDPSRITHMTVHELANECGTVPSAVIRFCKSIEIDGFSQLKLSLAHELGKNSESSISHDEDLQPFEKVFRLASNALADTMDMLDSAELKRIVTALINAGRVLIFGIGPSATIATDAAYRFSRLGISAYAYSDVLFMTAAAQNMHPNDVAVFISHSGQTKVIVDALRHVKSTGACAIGITSHSDSILYKESDLSVCVYADEEHYPVEAVSARVAHLCMIDAIIALLSQELQNDTQSRLDFISQVFEEIYY